MPATLRTTLSLLAGIAVTFFTISAVEQVGHLLFPLPPTADLQDSTAVAAYMKQLPVAALLLVLIGWLLGVLTGMTAASLLAGRPRGRFALTCGGLVILGAAANFYLLPHPQWLIWLSFILLPLVTFAGWRALRARYLQILLAQRKQQHE
jgi:hypothetical protein